MRNSGREYMESKANTIFYSFLSQSVNDRHQMPHKKNYMTNDCTCTNLICHYNSAIFILIKINAYFRTFL